MHFYMSGTPRNDKHQDRENTLCTHRLFSLHGSYRTAVMRWLRNVKDKLEADPGYVYPRAVLLDSGAFTAWNAGHETDLSDVVDAYSSFMQEAGDDLFDEIWCINLDKIPGERGRDPTGSEIAEALVVSDANYLKLIDIFGDRIMPVYHQGEDYDRLVEVAQQTAGKSDYICVSPRNDLPESARFDWSGRVHRFLHKERPECRTHGLATTGNTMIQRVPWYSIDSAAWVLHSGYGMVDIYQVDRYRNYFVTHDSDKHIRTGTAYHRTTGDKLAKGARGSKHFDDLPPARQAEILAIIESYGFTLAQVRKDSRARSLICMGELNRYADWAREFQKTREFTAQPGLLEIL